MRAKSINEIKRGEKSSGLSAIGIGKEYILSTYNFIKRNFREVITYSDELDGVDLLPDEVKEKVVEIFDANQLDVMGITDGLINTYVSDSLDFLNWIENIKSEDDEPHSVLEKDDKKYKIYNRVKLPFHVVRVMTYNLVQEENPYTGDVRSRYAYSMNESFYLFRI